MLKILIVEDDQDWQQAYRRALGDRWTLLSALTLNEGKELFLGNPDIALIVVDACIQKDEPNAMGWVKEIRLRGGFSGPMIAASRSEYFRELLLNAGCDHQAEKFQVANKIRELLLQ